MKFHISKIPQEIIDEYKLLDIVDNHGFVYVKIVKGMYGLKQAGIISHKALISVTYDLIKQRPIEHVSQLEETF